MRYKAGHLSGFILFKKNYQQLKIIKSLINFISKIYLKKVNSLYGKRKSIKYRF